MIHSSAIQGHHFLVTRRNGYDPAEVDAVIHRLVETLRKYEVREEELAAAEAAGLSLAKLEVNSASHDDGALDIEELEGEARRRLKAAETTAAALMAAAEEESNRIRELARADAANLTSRHNARAEELITSALTEVKALRSRVLHEANEYRAGKKTEAVALVRSAELQSAQMLEDARHEAGSILGRARREHTMLEQRIGQLRSAVAGIEGQFRALAETTLEQTEVMSTMLALETEPLQDALEATGESPDVVRLTQGGLTVDLTEEPAEASDEPGEHSERDDRFVVAPGDTIYQRRGGGLRRRLEEENAPELPD